MFPNFLEEISILSHYIHFLYFFALITKEGFLISPCYSLELAILWNSEFKRVYPSFSSLLLASLLFPASCKASSDSHFAFWHFFSLGYYQIICYIVPCMMWLLKCCPWGLLGGPMVRNPPALQEMQFQSVDQGRSSGEGNGNPLQDSCLGIPVDRGPGRPWGHKKLDTT